MSGYESRSRHGDYLPRPVVGKQTLLSTREGYVLNLASMTAGVVSRCCVVACQNSVCKKPGLRFLKLHVRAKSRLKRWTEVVRRSVRRAKSNAERKSKCYTVICSYRFIDGKLSHGRGKRSGHSGHCRSNYFQAI